MKWWSKIKKNYFSFLVFGVLFFFNALILRPILKEDVFFPCHDSTWLVRLQQFDRALKLRQIPPQLAPEMAFGFGYPLFRYYAPFFTFLSWIFLKLSGSYSLGVTMAIFLANFLGTWGMYLLARQFFPPWGSLLSSLAFLFLPYRAVDLYVRGALAELLAINILPWLIYFLVRLPQVAWWQKPFRGIFFGFSLSLAFLIIAHNLYPYMVVLLAPFFLVFFFSRDKKRKKGLAGGVLGGTVLALLLSSWYWLPLVAGIKEINVFSQATKTDYRQHFVYLGQVWNSPWGFGGSVPGKEDGFSFKAGKGQIILALLGLLALGKYEKEKRGALISLLLWGGGALFLALAVSRFFWCVVPFLPIIQFPWRFLGIFGLVIAFFSGGIFVFLKKKPWLSLAAFCFLASLLVFFNLKYFAPHWLITEAEEQFLAPEKIEKAANQIAEYFPRDAWERPQERPPQAIETEEGKVILDSPYKIILEKETPGQVVVNRFYFSGWHLYQGEKEIPLHQEKKYGRISFQAAGAGQYLLAFKNNLAGKIGIGMTLFSLLLIFLFLIY